MDETGIQSFILSDAPVATELSSARNLALDANAATDFSLSSSGGEGRGEEAPAFGRVAENSDRRCCSAWIPNVWLWWSQADLRRIWRDVALILELPLNLHAARSTMQCIPNPQQDSLSVSSPLVVPKSQFLDPFRIQESFAREVALPLIRKAVREAVEFNRQLRLQTIRIQGKRLDWMLTAELEPCKSAGTQCPPQLLFLLGLVPAETPHVTSRIHSCDGMDSALENKTKLIDNAQTSSPLPSPPGEERENRHASLVGTISCLHQNVGEMRVGPLLWQA